MREPTADLGTGPSSEVHDERLAFSGDVPRQDARAAWVRLIGMSIALLSVVWGISGWVIHQQHQNHRSFEALQLALQQSVSQKKLAQQQATIQAARLQKLAVWQAKVAVLQTQSALQWAALGVVLPTNGYWLQAQWQPQQFVGLAVVEHSSDWVDVQERWRSLMATGPLANVKQTHRIKAQPLGNWEVEWQVAWGRSDGD